VVPPVWSAALACSSSSPSHLTYALPLPINRSRTLPHLSPSNSEYKGRHTIKFLIGITPAGTISFVSDGFPGSFTDDQIVRASGLLNLLEKGDSVMAARGFKGFGALRQAGFEYIVPSLSHTKGKGHGLERADFTAEENERTYHIAAVRIHVERMMRAIKAGWGILEHTIPSARVPMVSRHVLLA